MKALIIPVQQEPVVLDFPDEGGAGCSMPHTRDATYIRLAVVTFCTSGGGNDSDGGDEMRDSEQRQPDEDDASMQEVSSS